MRDLYAMYVGDFQWLIFQVNEYCFPMAGSLVLMHIRETTIEGAQRAGGKWYEAIKGDTSSPSVRAEFALIPGLSHFIETMYLTYPTV